jgi:hypothetical protein
MSQPSRSELVDPLIDEVRQRRRDLLASCGDDLEVLARLIRAREAEHPAWVTDPRTVPAPNPGPEG